MKDLKDIYRLLTQNTADTIGHLFMVLYVFSVFAILDSNLFLWALMYGYVWFYLGGIFSIVTTPKEVEDEQS